MKTLAATYAGLMALVLLAALALRYWDPQPAQQTRAIAFDTYQRLSPRAYDPQLPVRIVDIDEASLRARGQWPWPRSDLAEMVDRLAAMGAAAIVFDMVFPEPDRLSPEQLAKRLSAGSKVAEAMKLLATSESNDQLFADAISRATVVVGFVGVPDGAGHASAPRVAEIEIRGDDPAQFVPAFSNVIVNLPLLSDKAAGSGAINWIADYDQVIRKLPLVVRVGDGLYPTLATEALRTAQAIANIRIISSGADRERSFGAKTGLSRILIGAISVPTDSEGQVWLRFTHSDPRRYISAQSLFDGTAKPEEVKGRIVLVGTSAAGLLDIRATPLDASIPGVEIHAEAIEQVLTGTHLRRPDFAAGSEIIFTIVAGCMLALAVFQTGAAIGAVVGGCAVVVVSATSWIAFSDLGWLLDPVFPIVTLSSVYLSGSSYLRLVTERERNAGLSKLRRIAQEMESAAQIQRSFLPQQALVGPGAERFDIFATMQPAKDVGGDFYDYFLINPDTLGVVIGDVSGKGVPAALFMSVSRTILRTIAFEGEAPGNVLTRVNEILARDNSESMFVTIFYASLELNTGALSYSSGGHDDTVLLRHGAPSENLGVMGPAIGLFDFAHYRTETRTLAPGDILLLITDGITEAFDKRRQAYGHERLLELVKRGNFSSATELVASLTASVGQFSRGAEQSDDITCIAMRYAGP